MVSVSLRNIGSAVTFVGLLPLLDLDFSTVQYISEFTERCHTGRAVSVVGRVSTGSVGSHSEIIGLFHTMSGSIFAVSLLQEEFTRIGVFAVSLLSYFCAELICRTEFGCFSLDDCCCFAFNIAVVPLGSSQAPTSSHFSLQARGIRKWEYISSYSSLSLCNSSFARFSLDR